MSLAPSERRALARIESLLRSSDPRLAAMLATFTHPAHRATSWIKHFLPVTLAMAVICLVILGELFIGHNSQLSCSAGHARATAVWQIGGCTQHPLTHRIT
jgi:hypothetical protein